MVSLLAAESCTVNRAVEAPALPSTRDTSVMTRVGGAGGPGGSIHGSSPRMPSEALKNSVPLAFVKCLMPELPLPGLMSLTMTVPAVVPLLCHNSKPLAPSWALKNSVPLTFVRPPGYELLRTYFDQGGMYPFGYW